MKTKLTLRRVSARVIDAARLTVAAVVGVALVVPSLIAEGIDAPERKKRLKRSLTQTDEGGPGIPGGSTKHRDPAATGAVGQEEGDPS